MPMRFMPSWSSARTRAPRKAPMTVPDPPAREVPPITAAETAVNMIPKPPPRLGSMVLMRKASRIPANPPRVATIMKLPILMRPARMPASVAPSGLPPTAMVCRPQRVRVSSRWKPATISRHQVMWAQSEAPNQLRIVFTRLRELHHDYVEKVNRLRGRGGRSRWLLSDQSSADGRPCPPQELDDGQDDQQGQGEADDDLAGRPAPEDQGQGGRGHGGDAQGPLVGADPGADRAGAQAGVLGAALEPADGAGQALAGSGPGGPPAP